MTQTVRDATFDVMRRFGMTTIFGNPGSTEITFLTDLPPDIRFVLGLHEGSVVGIASGYAIGSGEPAFVNLHTAPGLGNAVNAIANARDARAPLVILVGQQDRRQIAFEPFLTGRHLERLAGDYTVWANLPVRPQDVPGAIGRAYHEAKLGRGPALVVVPMGDWSEPADPLAAGTPGQVVHPRAVEAAELAPLGELLAEASSPALVVGAGADSREGWDALVELAERLQCPVWQEPFGSRAGFPQDHHLFAGHLPWMRGRLHDALAGHDLVVAVGTHAFRAYLFDEPVALVDPGVRVAVITEDPAEAHRSPCDVAVVAPVAQVCAALAAVVPARIGGASAVNGATAENGAAVQPARPAPPAPGERLRAAHVLGELAARLPADAIVVEETPSSRPELHEWIAARAPMGFLSNANGGLGFGFTGAIGARMAQPERPVVGVIGDGSAMYAIQSLWTAATYGVGVVLIVMANGGYAIMDALARAQPGTPPWPGFGEIDIAGMARCLGCPSVRVETFDELTATLDGIAPGLADRTAPLVVEVAVAP